MYAIRSYYVAGANFRFNSVTIDGVAQNDNFGLSKNASATQRTPISIDAIGAICSSVISCCRTAP